MSDERVEAAAALCEIARLVEALVRERDEAIAREAELVEALERALSYAEGIRTHLEGEGGTTEEQYIADMNSAWAALGRAKEKEGLACRDAEKLPHD